MGKGDVENRVAKGWGKKGKCQDASHLPQAQFSFLPMAHWQIP